jgi:hypothetical protein
MEATLALILAVIRDAVLLKDAEINVLISVADGVATELVLALLLAVVTNDELDGVIFCVLLAGGTFAVVLIDVTLSVLVEEITLTMLVVGTTVGFVVVVEVVV